MRALLTMLIKPSSPSSRRAWIEITSTAQQMTPAETVALLAEGVDRNSIASSFAITRSVALLAEGVDRNILYHLHRRSGTPVALLAEGVDRNTRC